MGHREAGGERVVAGGFVGERTAPGGDIYVTALKYTSEPSVEQVGKGKAADLWRI